MIDPTFKQAWVAALRSGDFIQGEEALKTPNNTYCCLGVACVVAGYDLSKPRNLQTDWKLDRGENLGDVIPGIDPSEATILAKMNDGGSTFGKRTFLEIADWIEENL